MKRFTKALGNAEKVWFELTDQDKRDFLIYAREIGCTWLNGEPIEPDRNACNYHMSIHADFKIASVPYFVCFANQFNDIKKLRFSDFLTGTECTPQSKFIGEFRMK